MAEWVEIAGQSLGDVSLLGFDFQKTELSVRSVEAVPGGGISPGCPQGKQGLQGCRVGLQLKRPPGDAVLPSCAAII